MRILGIDTPETRHLEHNLPYAQSFGPEVRGVAQGAFAAATQVELIRASTVDPYGRSLGYLFLNGRNYSVLVVQAPSLGRDRHLLRGQRPADARPRCWPRRRRPAPCPSRPPTSSAHA